MTKKNKVPKSRPSVKRTIDRYHHDEKLANKMDHIAVLHFIKDDENLVEEMSINSQSHIVGCTFYASLPFMSLVQNVNYPYRRGMLRIDFEKIVLDNIKALQMDLSNPKTSTSRSPYMELPNEYDPYPAAGNIKKPYYKKILHGAKSITDSIGIDDLRPLLDTICSHQGKLKLLQICTTKNINLPWDWILCEDRNNTLGGDKLLCELFGVGVTYLTEPHRIHIESRSDKIMPREDCQALIIGNAYPDTDLSLPLMDQKNEELESLVKNAFECNAITTLRNPSKKDINAVFERIAGKLRLIILSGHFENRGFLTADRQFLDSDNIYDFCRGHNSRPFTAKPMVLLNGCSSKSISSHGTVSRSLADSFHKLGAEVCVVTSLDVRIEPAFDLIIKLMKKLLEPKSTLGSALLQARNNMDKDRYYEWAAYHIIGDPSYVLFES